MRLFRDIILGVLIVPSVVFLIGYARVWQATDCRIIGLVDPHVCIYRHGEHVCWEAFIPTDPPEGTRSIFYFPSWPFAAAAAGVLVFAGYSIYEQTGKRLAQQIAAGNAG